MSFQKTFDINYYYYHCYCTFIHCSEKNDAHNLENKRPIKPGVTYLYPLKTSKIL